MSTKKTVHTVTAEQKEWLDKHANILARMETGKVELMKIVGNVPGAEKLPELFEKGKKKGKQLVFQRMHDVYLAKRFLFASSFLFKKSA